MSNASFLKSAMPQVMGILNVTPDSFSDGGKFNRISDALRQAEKMVEDGASIIDVGGESTRPGAELVSEQEELDRVVPVIEAICQRLEVTVSIDTSKPDVMQAAVGAGAKMINDVLALRAEGALEMAARLGVPICLMHMQGQPRTMQAAPMYQNVVQEVKDFLEDRVAKCEEVGIARELLLIDPGFGFGKTLEHNVLLLRELDQLQQLNVPVLVGISRKSMIGAILADQQGQPREVGARAVGSVAAALWAVERGVSIIRVHDVKETVDALKVWMAVAGQV